MFISGFYQLKSSFDRIQNFGKKMDETGIHMIAESDALRGVETTLGTLKLKVPWRHGANISTMMCRVASLQSSK